MATGNPLLDNRYIRAFLETIKWAEGADYNTLVYEGTRNNNGLRYGTSGHPAENGWQGHRRPDGRLTTAAGAYQFVLTTWREVKSTVQRWTGKVDFSPESQDAAAVARLYDKHSGALQAILQGKAGQAGKMLAGEWEGFRGKSSEQIQSYFESVLGGKAATNTASGEAPARTRDNGKPVNQVFRKQLILTTAAILLLIGIFTLSGKIKPSVR